MEHSLQSISIIIPVYNESTNLIPLYQALKPVLQSLSASYRFSILFVNDGSTDNSLQIIQYLTETDTSVHWISLSRNFGKEIALTAGLDQSDSDAVILLDADLQHPPSLIPVFLSAWKNGFDGAYAEIKNRPHESWVKRKLTHYFYGFLQRISNVPIPPNAGDFRLLSRQMVKAMQSMREQHRYLKGLYAWSGFTQKPIPYTPNPRHTGLTTWSYSKLIHFALEGITAFSIKPLQGATYLGILSCCSAFFYGVYCLANHLLNKTNISSHGILLFAILLLGGAQLLTLGILGEYIGRMFNETKKRPLYFIHRMSEQIDTKNASKLSRRKKNRTTEPELN